MLDSLGLSSEIIFVDDGSLDGSVDAIQRLAATDAGIQTLLFARNFGQTAALAAGFEHARGKIIIPLDADLQNDPQDIPLVVEKLNQGYDVVSCWRKQREGSLAQPSASFSAGQFTHQLDQWCSPS